MAKQDLINEEGLEVKVDMDVREVSISHGFFNDYYDVDLGEDDVRRLAKVLKKLVGKWNKQNRKKR